MSTKKFNYEFHRLSESVAKITNPVEWTLSKMNELGAQGKRVLNAPMEFQEPGTFSNGQGQNIPNYGIMFFTEQEIATDEAAEAPPI